MKKDPAHEFVNIGAQLLQPGAHSKHSAITNVDPLGVIERFTFSDVARKAALWTSLVRQNELRPGDRVVVLAGPAWEWRCALLGVLYAGGVAVPYPDTTSAAELKAIAADAGAGLIVSIPARPDLVGGEGPRALTGEQLVAIDERGAMRQPPHPTLPNDGALILYARTAGKFRGAVHTHASLAAQADSGEYWLGVGEDERVLCTATEGLAESIWLLLAAGRAHADVVGLNLELDPEEELGLLQRLSPSALWLSDDEYGALASAAATGWFDLASIRRVLTSDDSSAGATAFADAFGASVTPLFGLNEVGVFAGWPAGREDDAVEAAALPVPGIPLAIVDEQGERLPTDQVGKLVVRGDAPSLSSGYAIGETRRRDSWFHLQCRGALAADNSLRIDTRPPLDTELREVEVEMPGVELSEKGAQDQGADAPEISSRPSKREAKEARRRQEREAKEQRKAEERRRREEEKSRKLAGRAEEKKRKEAERAEDEQRREQERLAKERQQAEAKERARREAAEAEERRREEDEKKREQQQLAEERAKAEAEERARLEAAEKEERRRNEEAAQAEERARAERARREAAEAEERRRAEEAALEEERRREEEEKQRLAEQRAKAEAEERALREAAEAEERRRNEETARAESQRREEEEKLRLAEERGRAEAEERARREAAEAEERRRAEEAARAEALRRQKDDDQRGRDRLRQEEEARRREERQAKETARAQRKAVRLGRRGRGKESEADENGVGHPGDSEPEAEPEHVSADILSRISQYGMNASPTERDARPEADAPPDPRSPAEPESDQ